MTTFSKTVQHVSNENIENRSERCPDGSLWIRMGPYGSWGPFPRVPAPKPLKIIQKYWFGFFWGVRGTPCPRPCLVAYVGSSLIWPYGLLMVICQGFRDRGPLEQVHSKIMFIVCQFSAHFVGYGPISAFVCVPVGGGGGF